MDERRFRHAGAAIVSEVRAVVCTWSPLSNSAYSMLIPSKNG